MAVVAVPYFYVFKQRCLPSDFGAIGRELARNAVLALICLLPSGLLAWALRPAGSALALTQWLPFAALTILLWLGALPVLRHPLYPELRALLRRRTAA
jgi:hypothetical protein